MEEESGRGTSAVRVLFWGSPEFAIPSLSALVESKHEVVGVVTQPDRPAGRGRNLRRTAIKSASLQYGFPILEPVSPSEESFIRVLQEIGADASVVVAYGKKLPESLLGMFPFGCINIHASLLPSLRGAAPINWALIRGLRESGVTVMRMVGEMDAGPILFQLKEGIGSTDTAWDLEERLAGLGAKALIHTLESLENGSLESREQDDSRVTYAPKIRKSTARIDWLQSASSIADMVRGMDKRPGAWSLMLDMPIKLFKGIPIAESVSEVLPGTVLMADATSGLMIATGGGILKIGEVQPPGKTRMSARSWILGRGIEVGQRFQ
ncbi:uncharacterized protein METZ01_LOCUS280812 [marine metagenome]|uniref:methionyl-tRNA formyltransferase n=1 Tax=marine metagenome TaxID=408172 RepID=A0A382KTQ4_9ZZZZ